MKMIKMLIYCFIALTMFTTQNAFPKKDTPKFKINNNKIFVLEPLVTYEHVRNEQPIYDFNPKITERVLTETMAQLKKEFAAAGVIIVINSDLSLDEQTTIKNQLVHIQTNVRELLKEWKGRDDYLNDFALIAEKTGCDAIFVPYVQVKVGQGGSWDFVYSGAIYPGTSTTTLRAMLISLNDGKTSWTNASFYRDIPNYTIMTKCTKDLFENIQKVEKSKKEDK